MLDVMQNSKRLVYQSTLPFVEDRERLWNAIGSIPICKREKMESYIKIMTVCAEYITLSNGLNPASESLAYLTRRYIHQHCADPLTLSALCNHFHCSKSSLMNAFRNTFGDTINCYLNQVRLSRARELLSTGTEPISKIAATCGFANQNYFSKVFSKAFGCTPSQFRRSKMEESGHADSPRPYRAELTEYGKSDPLPEAASGPSCVPPPGDEPVRRLLLRLQIAEAAVRLPGRKGRPFLQGLFHTTPP